jgi:hypothetical protein
VGEGGAPTLPPELTLQAVSLYQTLEVPLMEAGHAVPRDETTLPLIAGKRALLRAFVELDERFEPRPLLGVLDIRTDAREHSVVSERTLTGASAREDLSSTFVFDVDAEDLEPGSEYRVRVLEADTSLLARFPEEGFAELGVREVPPFRVVVVPYAANGLLPKTGDEELAALRRRLVALYPSRDVELTLSQPVTLDYAIAADGAGWDDALDLIYELRERAAPAPDTFYYGVLAPAASYDAYCKKGCLLGYSIVADEAMEAERGSIGVGVFPDGSGTGDFEDTAAHELGHALGRDHAPCGISDPSDIDPAWPKDTAHKGAAIGVFGYDFELARLIKPRPSKDVMSYCSPSWISDYTYAGIFERLLAIANQGAALPSVREAEVLRVARIRRSGHSRWVAPRLAPGVRFGATASLLDSSQRLVGRAPARFARVDHGPGGYVWLPEPQLVAPGAVSVDLRPFGGGILPL